MTSRVSISLLSLPFLLFFFCCKIAAADDTESWAGTHYRLVWVQDHGDGADSLAHGRNLVLYGLDSRDGRGERPLVKEKGNYFKPLITPDGKQVVVSDRLSRQMYVIDWETGKQTALGQGVAVEVWQEPEGRFFFSKPRVWVYCFSGLQPENKYGTSQPLYRFELDNPKKKELIWDSTNMAWSNVQLSRDGEMIGGLFPWPHGGVLSGKDHKWQRLGRGCWTSLSPDNSKILWIFDGLHRNVLMHKVESGESWKVNVNSGPGMNGFEVYHPRWSNHPRYFVLTGPYEKGEGGGNRIGGGGDKVEIVAGRFDAQAKNIESWRQLTHNKKADFYPDLWLENGEKADLEDGLTQPVIAEKALPWPASSAHLLFLWENMKAANQLSEDSPVGFYQCAVDLHGRALHTRNLELSLAGGWADTGDAGQKISGAQAGKKELAVEFSATTDPGQSGRIVAFTGSGADSLSLWQEKTSFTVKVGDKIIASWDKTLGGSQQPTHFALNLSDAGAELFVNGESVGRKKVVGGFKMPVASELVLGDTDGTWSGVLANLAIYNATLASDQIRAGAAHVQKNQSRGSGVERLVVTGRLLEKTEIPPPDSIGAYSRALVVNTYSVDSVQEGKYDGDRILVAEWAVLDRQIVKEYGSKDAETLILEKFGDHPELEGERQMMDLFEPDLEMYYRLSP